jgi:hypothetical protein
LLDAFSQLAGGSDYRKATGFSKSYTNALTEIKTPAGGFGNTAGWQSTQWLLPNA